MEDAKWDEGSFGREKVGGEGKTIAAGVAGGMGRKDGRKAMTGVLVSSMVLPKLRQARSGGVSSVEPVGGGPAS